MAAVAAFAASLCSGEVGHGSVGAVGAVAGLVGGGGAAAGGGTAVEGCSSSFSSSFGSAMPVVVVGEVAIGLSPPPLLPPVPAAASGRSLGAAAGASASSAISLLRERVEERAKERRSSRERESKAIGTLQLEELWSEEEGDLAIRRSRLIQIQSEKKKERRNHGLHPPLPLRLRLVQARARRGRSSSRSRRGGLRHLALGDKRQLQGRGRQEARPELVPAVYSRVEGEADARHLQARVPPRRPRDLRRGAAPGVVPAGEAADGEAEGGRDAQLLHA